MQPLWKTVWNFLKKLKMELPFDLAVSLFGLYPKSHETSIQKNVCSPRFIAVLFTIAKLLKQPKCPSINEWIKKVWYIYTMQYYTAERKELLQLNTRNTNNPIKKWAKDLHTHLSLIHISEPTRRCD